MKSHHLAISALALTAAMAVPAAAQVNGIGVTDPAIAIAGSQALQTSYQQIGTTYQAQRTQLEQLQGQRDTLVRQFDTNNDGQLTEAEQTAAQANATAVQQLTSLEDQVALSSLTVSLVEKTERIEADPAGFGDGLVAGWNGLVATLNGLVIGVGFLLPWIAVAAVVALVVWGIIALVRRRRARTAATPGSADTDADDAP